MTVPSKEKQRRVKITPLSKKGRDNKEPISKRENTKQIDASQSGDHVLMLLFRVMKKTLWDPIFSLLYSNLGFDNKMELELFS